MVSILHSDRNTIHSDYYPSYNYSLIKLHCILCFNRLFLGSASLLFSLTFCMLTQLLVAQTILEHWWQQITFQVHRG